MNAFEFLAAKWPEVVGGLIGAVLKWLAIGALLHLGWKVAA